MSQKISTILTLSLVAALVFPCTGCSLAFSRGPSGGATKDSPAVAGECTTSMTLPVVDTVLATTQAGSAIAVAAATEAAQGNARLLRTGLIAADVGTAILLVASAVHGYTRVSACRKLKGGAPATAAVAP